MRLLYPALFAIGVVIGFMAYAPAPAVRYVDLTDWTESEITRFVMRQL